MKIICKLFRHNYIKKIRNHSPGYGREEMRCTRCKDWYLLPWKNPKDKLVTDEDRKKRLGL